MTDKNANTEIRKEFCPNCEKDTECIHAAELYECQECGDDFAKYIVPRTAPCTAVNEPSNSDVSTTQDILTPIKTSQSNENTNPDYYKHDELKKENAELKADLKNKNTRIAELEAENAELRDVIGDYRNDVSRVLDEKCPSDERHCGCVPILRDQLNKYQKALILITTMPELSQATIAREALQERGKFIWTEQSVGEYWVTKLDILQDKFDTLEKDYADVCQKRLEAADVFSRQIIELESENAELKADLKNKNTRIAELEAHIAELEAHIAALEEAADIEEWDDFPNFPEPPEGA